LLDSLLQEKQDITPSLDLSHIEREMDLECSSNQKIQSQEGMDK